MPARSRQAKWRDDFESPAQRKSTDKKTTSGENSESLLHDLSHDIALDFHKTLDRPSQRALAGSERGGFPSLLGTEPLASGQAQCIQLNRGQHARMHLLQPVGFTCG